jgi:hypothetical protein
MLQVELTVERAPDASTDLAGQPHHDDAPDPAEKAGALQPEATLSSSKAWLEDAWSRFPKRCNEKVKGKGGYAERLSAEAAKDDLDLPPETIRVRYYEHQRDLEKAKREARLKKK